MTGDCALVYALFACYSPDTCQIIGVSGTMNVQQTGSGITISIASELSSSPIVFSGSAGASSFTVNYLLSETDGGCTLSIPGAIDGTTNTSNSFSGVMGFNMALSGSCEGYTMGCSLKANYTATKQNASSEAMSALDDAYDADADLSCVGSPWMGIFKSKINH